MVELTLVALAALAWFWADALKARERALAACAHACAQQNLQFLDNSVVLVKLRLVRAPTQWQRTYRFEYSSDGAARWQALLVLRGRTVIKLERSDGRDWWDTD